jgi:hypothetical protein
VAGAGAGAAGAGAGVGDGVGVAAGGVSGVIDGTCCGPGTTTRCCALCFGTAAGVGADSEPRAWPLNAWAATTDSVVARPAVPAARAQLSLRTLRSARSRREGLI